MKDCHCDSSSFVLMLVCLLFVCLFVFVSLFIGFLLPLHIVEQIQYGWNKSITLFVCLCLRLPVPVDLLYNHFCAGREFKNTLRPLK